MGEENTEHQTIADDGATVLDESQDTVKQSENSQEEELLGNFDINSNVSDKKSKFKAIKFKEALKTKGRPKKGLSS